MCLTGSDKVTIRKVLRLNWYKESRPKFIQLNTTHMHATVAKLHVIFYFCIPFHTAYLGVHNSLYHDLI